MKIKVLNKETREEISQENMAFGIKSISLCSLDKNNNVVEKDLTNDVVIKVIGEPENLIDKMFLNMVEDFIEE